jgi:hypothetical protein
VHEAQVGKLVEVFDERIREWLRGCRRTARRKQKHGQHEPADQFHGVLPRKISE